MLPKARRFREAMVEAAAETEEELMDKYLAGEDLTEDEIRRGLRRGVIRYQMVPVLCGASYRNKGVQPLLDAIVDFLPSPLDVPPVQGVDPQTNEAVSRKAEDDEPLAALAFKVAVDRNVGQLVYLRIYSGTLVRGGAVLQLQQAGGAARGPHPAHARQPAGAVARGLRGRHHCRRRPRSRRYRRHAVRSARPDSAGKDPFPGAGDLRRRRAGEPGGRSEAGGRPRRPLQRRSDLPLPHRSGQWPDHHLRDGRAAPRHRDGPDAPRVSGTGARGAPPGGLSRDGA